MVEFVGTRAQLGADMRSAIACALSPSPRLPLRAVDGVRLFPLDQALEPYDRSVFERPTYAERRFAGAGTPAALNALNEVLVAQFWAVGEALSIVDDLGTVWRRCRSRLWRATRLRRSSPRTQQGARGRARTLHARAAALLFLVPPRCSDARWTGGWFFWEIYQAAQGERWSALGTPVPAHGARPGPYFYFLLAPFAWSGSPW